MKKVDKKLIIILIILIVLLLGILGYFIYNKLSKDVTSEESSLIIDNNIENNLNKNEESELRKNMFGYYELLYWNYEDIYNYYYTMEASDKEFDFGNNEDFVRINGNKYKRKV